MKVYYLLSACSRWVVIVTALLLTVPEAPRNISVKLDAHTSVIVTWMPPKNPNGVIQEYQIEYTGYIMKSNTVCISL